jgi:hypothetical protein
VWPSLVWLLVAGYLVLGRSFAYLGWPAQHLFIGELSLALFAVTRPRALFGRWAGAILNSTPLAPLGWSLIFFIGYGGFELLRGIAAGNPPTRALQTFVFCVYPLYVFLGVMVGLKRPELLSRLLGVLAWVGGAYGLVYVAWLNRLDWSLPWAADVPVLSFGGVDSVALVALISSTLPLAVSWVPLLANAAVLFAILLRSRWLGVMVAVTVVAGLRGKLVRVLALAVAAAMVLALAVLLDFEMPAPVGRGGTLSAREVVARSVAVVDPAGAAALGTETQGSAATITWRFDLWRAVWNDVHHSPGRALLGWGHGASLRDVAPFVGEDLRSPHSIFLFALAYTGWIGVAAFAGFQLALLELAWRSYRLTGHAFAVGCWVLHLVATQFENMLETPFAAIPFYLLMGLAVAPVLARVPDDHASTAPA